MRPMGTGKKKIEIKLKEKESERMVTFSKRRKGLFKKAHELHSLAGAKVAVLVFSLAGKPFTHGYPSFDAVVDQYCNSIAATDSSSSSSAVEEGTELWRSWRGAMEEDYNNVEDLHVLKKDLEKIRSKLIQGTADD